MYITFWYMYMSICLIYDHLLMSVVWKCNLVEPMFTLA